nr:RHS repeat-associated core domain-containing protein [Anatilimnocola aggregata]
MADGAALGTIEDDDATPSISIDDVNVSEGIESKYATVTVTLSSQSSWEITADYSAEENDPLGFFGAEHDDDFSVVGGIVTFAPGETEKTFLVPIVDDNLWEFDENFKSTLSNLSLHVSAGDLTGKITIEDNDNPFGKLFVCSCWCNCLNGVVTSVVDSVGAMLVKFSSAIYLSKGNPHPTIALDVPFTPSSGTPDAIEAQLTFGGIIGDSVFYDASSLSSGETYRFALQADATSLPTGEYPWEMTLTEHYPSLPSVTRTYRGRQEIVNQISSSVGNRWTIEGVDRLVVDENGASLVTSEGNLFRFKFNGEVYVATGDNPVDATLVYGGGEYVYRTVYGEESHFDEDGLLQVRIDKVGNVSTYTYIDADDGPIADDIETITDFFGRTKTFAYTEGRLSSVTDFAGRVTEYEHDEDGLLVSVTETDPDGAGPGEAKVTTFDYDPVTKLMTSITDAENQATTFEYRPDRSLYKRVAPDSTEETFAPSMTAGVVDTSGTLGSALNPAPLLLSSGVAGSFEDQSGNALSYTTDAFGNKTSTTDELGNVTIMERDSRGRLTRQVDPDPDGAGPLPAHETLYEYDALGNLLEMTLPDGSVRTWTYDEDWNVPLSYEDERGLMTLYTVASATGLVTAIRQVVDSVDDEYNLETDDVVTSFTFTTVPSSPGDPPAGLPERITDPLGRVTYLEYDGHGNLIRATYGEGTVSESMIQYFYDVQDLLEYELDPLGRRTDYTYDAVGQLVEVQQPDPDAGGPLARPTLGYVYNTLGQLVTEIDPLGRETSYHYDSLGRVTQVDRPDHDGDTNLTTSYTTYDDRGLPTVVTDPLGRVTGYEYDELGRLVLITMPDPDGGGILTSPETSFSYDAMGRKLTETDPLGNVTTYAYENYGRTVTITQPDPDGAGAQSSPVTVMTYDEAGNLLTVTDALGRVTTNEYDILGRLIRVTQPDPDDYGPLGAMITEYAYDKVGNLVTLTAPGGAVTSYEYDALNRKTRVTSPDPDGVGPLDSPVTEYVYDVAGQLLSVTDPLDRVTEYDYDGLGRLVLVTLPDPDGGGPLAAPEISYVYDAAGRKLSETDPLGNTTEYAYDLLDHMIELTQADPDGGGPLTSPVSEWLYDDAGQLLESTDALSNVTSYTYDQLGRTLGVTQPDPDGVGGASAPVTSYTYDAVGNRLTVTSPLSKVTTYVYDNLYRNTSVTDPLTGVTSFEYDAVGNRLSLTDPEENTTTWQFDALNRVVLETNELSATRTFEYSQAGDLTAKVDRLARRTEYEYDALHRRTAEKWYDGVSLVRTIGFEFDAASQLTEASDPAAINVYNYDLLGRVTQEVQTFAGFTDTLTFDYEFDAAGNRTESRWNFGTTEEITSEFEYDAQNRLKQLTRESDEEASFWHRVAFSYNKLGQYTELNRFVGDNTTPIGVADTAYSYDDLNRLTGILHTTGLTTWAGYDYTYDAASRILSIDSFLDGLSEYDYDDTDQLVGADHTGSTDETYDYDANGNRVTGYTTGDNNQLLSDGTYSYTYDAEGNRATRTNISTSYVTEYTWDHRNRLVAVTEKDDLDNVLSTVENSYDVFNRWIRRSVDSDGPGIATAVDSYFAYEGTQLTTEFSGDDGSDISHIYSWGQNTDELIADITHGSTPNFGLTDHLGTPRDFVAYDSLLTTTVDTGHHIYNAFGTLTFSTGITSFLGYTARPFEITIGLQYNLNRWYDATVGRWVSEDPIGFDGGTENLREYAYNNALSNTDPTGLIPPNPGVIINREIRNLGRGVGQYFSDWWFYANPINTDPNTSGKDCVDAALRIGTRLGQATAVIAGSAAAGFAVAGATGISMIGVVPLSQLPQTLALELAVWAGWLGIGAGGGSTIAERFSRNGGLWDMIDECFK